MITPAEARARGVAIPADDAVAQDIIDEQEAWLARRIGPLTGARTETFYVGLSAQKGKLALRRYTDSVTVTDAGSAVAAGHFRLIDNGSAIVRRYEAPSYWWTGPYVEVAYTPSDEDEVRRVLYLLLKFAVDPHADSPFNSEQIGGYGYSKGQSAGRSTTDGQRAALADSILPKRDPALTLKAVSRPLMYGDPIINRAEVIP